MDGATTSRRFAALKFALMPVQHRSEAAGVSAATCAAAAVPRVCIVTGMNKGVGYQIAKAMGTATMGRPGKRWHVISCARDPAKGEAAVQQLIGEGVPSAQIVFKQLDIDDQGSIEAFTAWFAAQPYGRERRLGALINNAAIQIEAGAPGDPGFAEQAQPTMHTNFTQTIALTEALAPYLSLTGRVVFVASMAGVAAFDEASMAIRDMLLAAERDVSGGAATLTGMAREVVAAAEATSAHDGSDVAGGWASSTYGTSKMLLIAYARWLARHYAVDPRTAAVRVNACCPGFCATDMTVRPGGVTPTGADMGLDRGQQSPADGARTPVWLATLPTPTGAATAAELAPSGGMFANHRGVNLAADAEVNDAGIAMMTCEGWW